MSGERASEISRLYRCLALEHRPIEPPVLAGFACHHDGRLGAMVVEDMCRYYRREALKSSNTEPGGKLI
jgi:hypothetical protein